MGEGENRRTTGRPLSGMSFLFCGFLFLFFLLSCDQISQQPLTGHRDIAVALRSLLDLAYTGPDYPTYHAEFQSFAKHVQEKIETAPHEMRPTA